MTRVWDERNRPKGYILGVTPGYAQFEQGDQRLTYMGFARKITKAARLGFEFAEIDFEQLSEALEPDIGNQVRRIKEAQGLEIGLHLPVEVDLTLADAFSWRYMHDQLKVGAKAAQDIGSKFMLFHTSSHMRPNITSVFGRPEPRQRLVSPEGTNLGDWVNEKGLKEWFMAKFIKVLYSAMGSAGDPTMIEFFEKEKSFKDASKRVIDTVENAEKKVSERWKELSKRIDEMRKKYEKGALSLEESGNLEKLRMEYEEISRSSNRYIREEMIKTLRDDNKVKEYMQVYQSLNHYNFDQIYDYWRKQGSEAEEYVAYLTVAEHIFNKGEKMWNLVDAGKNRRSPYDLAKDATEILGKEARMPEYIKQIVSAVAGEYIKGHLFAKGQQYGLGFDKGDKKDFISVYDFCKENRIHIFIETAMPERGAEGGELRIINLQDHVEIAKAIDGGENISYCMDFEHLIVNLVDPIKESLTLKNGDGKHIRMIHLNAPRPITGAHAPVEPLSLDMLIIYKWLYNLRNKGMKDAYILWEMGSYGARQSAIAFRNITNELQKGPPTRPDDLPPEFFGINEEMRARQMTSINQHALDPLKGLLMMPDSDWTMLGESARRRGHGAEWERRKYR